MLLDMVIITVNSQRTQVQDATQEKAGWKAPSYIDEKRVSIFSILFSIGIFLFTCCRPALH